MTIGNLVILITIFRLAMDMNQFGNDNNDKNNHPLRYPHPPLPYVPVKSTLINVFKNISGIHRLNKEKTYNVFFVWTHNPSLPIAYYNTY